MLYSVTLSDDQLLHFIEFRSHYKNNPDSEDLFYQNLLEELELNFLSISDAQSLWDSLVTEYKGITAQALESSTGSAITWPYYSAMHETMIALHPAQSSSNTQVGESGILGEHLGESTEEEAAKLEEMFQNVSESGNDNSLIDNLVYDVEVEGEEEEVEAEEEYLDEKTSVEFDVEQLKNCFDDIWTQEKVKEFIKLRGQKDSDLAKGNYNQIYGEMLDELSLTNQITPQDLQSKWTQLCSKYFSLKAYKSNIGEGEEQEVDVVWSLFDLMESVVKELSNPTSPSINVRRRKSPEFYWSPQNIKRLIRLRGEMHSSIANLGHNTVYMNILKKMGLNEHVTVAMARKKWNGLVKRYQDEEMESSTPPWKFFKEMQSVIKHFTGNTANKLQSRASPEFLWPDDLTKRFIELRVERKADFIEGDIQAAYAGIMEELGIDHILCPNQLRKKWNYLKAKYRELSCTKEPGSQSQAPNSWPFFDCMRDAMQKLPANVQAVRTNNDQIWTKETTIKFIELRSSKMTTESSKVSVMYIDILKELGLQDQVTPNQARKRWNYLWSKYLDLSSPHIKEYSRNSWPYYSVMLQSIGKPVPHAMAKKGYHDEKEEYEDLHRVVVKRIKELSCFLCGKRSRQLHDFFTFEQEQHLLHTSKTVVEIVSHLLGQKVVNMESSTCLCSTCTNLVNEADSVMQSHEKLKKQAQQLYSEKNQCRARDGEDIGVEEGLEEREEEEELEQSSSDQQQQQQQPEEVITEKEKDVAKLKEGEGVISYSKRGRKRKATIPLQELSDSIKLEPLDEGFDDLQGVDAPFEDDSEDERKRRKRTRLRGKGRGRGRVKDSRSTLIGRGLGGKYHGNNKRRVVFKGPKIYHCTECDAEFKKYSDLINHKKEEHTVVDTSNLEVQETVLENGVITYFNKGKANSFNTSHACRECSKVFLRKDDLWYHQELAHTQGKGRAKSAFKDRSYSCEECGENFLFKYKLKMHINSKHLNDTSQDPNEFTCGECGCKLGSLPGLTFHMRKHHNKALTYRKDTEYLCSDCGYMAPSSKKLKEHTESHCGSCSKPKVQCEICGKTVLKVSLKMHKVKMHSDFKEQCDRCGERYATKTDLLRHFNVVHLGILLYHCRSCSEKFATSDALRYHRVKVHEKPSFECNICLKSYKRVGELNTHIKRAHNENKKTEVCRICAKEYHDRSGLRNHLMSKHNVPQELTYSESYLRKKRVDGLPLAKHMERRENLQTKMAVTATAAPIVLTTAPQETSTHTLHLQHHPAQHHPTQTQVVIATQQPPQQAHITMGVMDEAAEAARNLGAYHDLGGAADPEEEGTLIVTGITETPSQVEQAVLVNPIPQAMMHPMQQVQHSIAMQHHMQQHTMQPHLNVLYPMNMHHPGPSHINM